MKLALFKVTDLEQFIHRKLMCVFLGRLKNVLKLYLKVPRALPVTRCVGQGGPCHWYSGRVVDTSQLDVGESVEPLQFPKL